MRRYLNDGSTDAPKLRVYLNSDNLTELPAESSWPGLEGDAALEQLKADGFEGVQLGDGWPVPGSPILPFCGLDRVNRADEADGIFARHADRGDQCITLHAGWGIEDDAEAQRLVEAILTASEKHSLPAFLETHRATITQDMWRTVQLLKAFPDLLINGDFSHYYCCQEMVYGGCEMKMDFMQPIFDRNVPVVKKGV